MGIIADIFNFVPNQSFSNQESDMPFAPASNDFESLLQSGNEQFPLGFSSFPPESDVLQKEVEELYEAGEELISEVLDHARDTTVSVLTSNEMQGFIDSPNLATLKGVVQSDEVASAIQSIGSIFQTPEFQNVVSEAVDVFRTFFGLGNNG